MGQDAPLRIAVWNADLSRDGPGLLLRDILSQRDPEIVAVTNGIAALRPDILLLTRFDHDPSGHALSALSAQIADKGLAYPYRYAPVQNRGLASDHDLDGDGRLARPEDAQGYGRFSGDGAMALLSLWPIGEVADHAAFLWRDLPAARLERVPKAVQSIQRLSSSAHWVVPVDWSGGVVQLLIWAATPPLFDTTGRNRDRNHDEAAFWLALLAGKLPFPAPTGAYVVMGHANLGPGQGDPAALNALAAHPHLTPVLTPASSTLRGAPAGLSWMQASRAARVVASGVYPPENQSSDLRHRMVWIDLLIPP